MTQILNTARPQFDRKPGQMLFTLAQDVIIDDKLVYSAGEQILMAVSPADVTNTTEELDTYLGGYDQFGFVADKASPIVMVDKEQGTRRDFKKENVFELVETKVGRVGAINQIDHMSETASFKCQEHALACFVPWQAQNDTNYDLEMESGEMLMDKLMLAREYRVMALLGTSGNWDSANYTTLTAGYQWNTGASKNPRQNLHDRVKASAAPVVEILMNPDVAFWFLSDTEVRAHMKQMLGDAAPSPDAARASDTQGPITFNIPGFPPITTAPAKYLSAGSLTYILGDTVLLLCKPPAARNGRRIATSFTFRTKGRSGTGIVSNRYVPQGKGINGGTMLEVGHSDDEIMISDIAGGAIFDVLA